MKITLLFLSILKVYQSCGNPETLKTIIEEEQNYIQFLLNKNKVTISIYTFKPETEKVKITTCEDFSCYSDNSKIYQPQEEQKLTKFLSIPYYENSTQDQAQKQLDELESTKPNLRILQKIQNQNKRILSSNGKYIKVYEKQIDFENLKNIIINTNLPQGSTLSSLFYEIPENNKNCEYFFDLTFKNVIQTNFTVLNKYQNSLIINTMINAFNTSNVLTQFTFFDNKKFFFRKFHPFSSEKNPAEIFPSQYTKIKNFNNIKRVNYYEYNVQGNFIFQQNYEGKIEDLMNYLPIFDIDHTMNKKKAPLVSYFFQCGSDLLKIFKIKYLAREEGLTDNHGLKGNFLQFQTKKNDDQYNVQIEYIGLQKKSFKLCQVDFNIQSNKKINFIYRVLYQQENQGLRFKEQKESLQIDNLDEDYFIYPLGNDGRFGNSTPNTKFECSIQNQEISDDENSQEIIISINLNPNENQDGLTLTSEQKIPKKGGLKKNGKYTQNFFQQLDQIKHLEDYQPVNVEFSSKQIKDKGLEKVKYIPNDRKIILYYDKLEKECQLLGSQFEVSDNLFEKINKFDVEHTDHKIIDNFNIKNLEQYSYELKIENNKKENSYYTNKNCFYYLKTIDNMEKEQKDIIYALKIIMINEEENLRQLWTIKNDENFDLIVTQFRIDHFEITHNCIEKSTQNNLQKIIVTDSEISFTYQNHMQVINEMDVQSIATEETLDFEDNKCFSQNYIITFNQIYVFLTKNTKEKQYQEIQLYISSYHGSRFDLWFINIDKNGMNSSRKVTINNKALIYRNIIIDDQNYSQKIFQNNNENINNLNFLEYESKSKRKIIPFEITKKFQNQILFYNQNPVLQDVYFVYFEKHDKQIKFFIVDMNQEIPNIEQEIVNNTKSLSISFFKIFNKFDKYLKVNLNFILDDQQNIKVIKNEAISNSTFGKYVSIPALNMYKIKQIKIESDENHQEVFATVEFQKKRILIQQIYILIFYYFIEQNILFVLLIFLFLIDISEQKSYFEKII